MRKFFITFVLAVLLCLIVSNAMAIGNYGVNLDSASYSNNNPFRNYWGQCTWYAWGRANEKWGANVPWVAGASNAKQWATNAINAGWPVDSTPRADSIAVWTNGTYGHVAYIESVANGYLYWSEANRVDSRYSEGNLNLSNGYYVGTYVDTQKYYMNLPDYYIHIASNVIFNANGGTGGPGSMKKVTGWVNTIPNSTPTRAGYEFVCWNSNADGSGEHTVYPGGGWGGDFDITFYAIWKATTCTVTFDPNGGTVTPTSKTYNTGSTYGELPTATRTGYSFEGWYTEASGGIQVTSSSEVTSSITLYAQWSGISCTLNYDANGGTVDPTSKIVSYGSNYGILATPIRKGYTFEGWYTAANGGAQVKESSTVSTTSSHTIYAHWIVNNYTITFNPNGGTVNPNIKTISYGSTYGTLPTPAKPGYVSDGWYTDAEGGSKVTASTVLTETTDQTVYAHWSPMGALKLPSETRTIDEEAFMDDSHISHVEIPASCTSIGNKAFANCANLVSVRILGRNTMFESDTFDGSPNVVIYCYSGSRVQRLANGDGIECRLIGVASDWVSADSVPSGAEITDRKWTYTLREYTESASASYAGWTKYDSKRTAWTAWSDWQNSEITKSDDREVDYKPSAVTGYKMITYCVTGPNGRSYAPSASYPLRLQHGPYDWTKEEFDSATVFPAGSYFNFADNVAGYVLDGTAYCKMDGSDTGGYVPMFIQQTISSPEQWRYRDAVYTYYYYKDTDKESTTDPSAQDHVSNVQEWVKYQF